MGLFPPLPPALPNPLAESGGTPVPAGGNSPGLSPQFVMSTAVPASGSLTAMAESAAQAAGVPVNLFLALVEAESGFHPDAVSSAGAMGLTQLMPATARALGVTNPFDPAQNLAAGARYLAQLLNQYHSVPLALAAYNAGPGAVNFYGGIPPYPETQAYVSRVMSLAGLAP
jgi:soluble lytic murein transglycosylase-like protein